MIKTKNKKSGVSIVELVIYVAIFSVIALLTVQTLIVMTNSFVASRQHRDFLQAGVVAIGLINTEIKGATSLDIVNSSFGSHPSEVWVDVDDGGIQRTRSITVDGNNNLVLKEDGVLLGVLTDPDISVDSFIARQIVTTHGGGVKVEITFSKNIKGAIRVENFYTTAIVRNEY